MGYKNILLAICVIACILFTVSSVVASDVNDTAISSDDTASIVEETDGEIVTSAQDDDVISNDDANTFTAL